MENRRQESYFQEQHGSALGFVLLTTPVEYESQKPVTAAAPITWEVDNRFTVLL